MSRLGGMRTVQLGKLIITLPKTLKNQKYAKGSVIMLHGSCDTGPGMKTWVDKVRESEFNFHDYRILYPSSPTLPYTLLNGQECGVWFDRLSFGPCVPEDLITIEATAKELSDLVKDESRNTGIPLNKMIIGGFSMGGIMALHLGYRFQPQMGGVFALSSFLPFDSEVFNGLKKASRIKGPIQRPLMDEKVKKIRPSNANKFQSDVKLPTPTIDKILKDIKLEEGVKPPQFPQLFMSQGLKDPLVLHPWARRTFMALRHYGVQGHFFTHPSTAHTIERSQLILLQRWIQDILTYGNNLGRPPKRKAEKDKRGNINDEACEPVVDPERW